MILKKRSAIDYQRLQSGQMRHDELAHQDIWRLEVADRLTHFTLHFAKYVGALVYAQRTGDFPLKKRVITDSLVIALATANTLGIDLTSATASTREESQMRVANGQFEGLVLNFAEVVGRISKACEAFDHAEKYPSIEVIGRSVFHLIPIIEALGATEELDLGRCVSDRWRSVERKYFQLMGECGPVASESVAA